MIAVDLFAGAGGLSLGFEQAGFTVAAAVELDPIHCATHEFNFPRSATICAGVESLSGFDIRNIANLRDVDIDVVCGGPPCQGFSLIGKRDVNDPRNGLVFHFLRLVDELKPKYFVMENVAGLAVGEHRRFLLDLMDEFERIGYRIERNAKILNAAHYGVPQNRRRIFVFGCREGVELPSYPEPSACPAGNMKLAAQMGDLPFGPTTRDALHDIPDADDFPELLVTDSVVTGLGEASLYAARLRGDVLDPDDYSPRRRFNANVLTASLRTVHTPESIARFAAAPCGETEAISRFHKLDPDGICNTLRAGTASNHGAFTSPRPIHYCYPRCITVREAARLHSYPDWFRFHVTKWHGFRQIGNSVPPLLGRAVAREIRRALGKKPHRTSKSISLGNPALLDLGMTGAADRYGVDAKVIEPRKRIVRT